jgi:hypothetical protein
MFLCVVFPLVAKYFQVKSVTAEIRVCAKMNSCGGHAVFHELHSSSGLRIFYPCIYYLTTLLLGVVLN